MEEQTILFSGLFTVFFHLILAYTSAFTIQTFPLFLFYPASHLDVIVHNINCTVEFSFTGINTELDQY